MRDSPLTIPLSEFAEALKVSMDTAKRCFAAGTFNGCAVTVQKTLGRHWRVVVQDQQYSISLCKLALDHRRLRIRKPKLKYAMPLLFCEDGAPRSPHEIIPYLINEMLDGHPQEIPMSPDETRRKSIAFFHLLWAAIELQKSQQRVTVRNLAKRMHVSIASLYRSPFGKCLMGLAIKKAVGANMRTMIEKVLGVNESSNLEIPQDIALAHANSLHMRTKDCRSYIERREDKRKRREKLSESLIFWHLFCHTDGMFTAALRLASAECVPAYLGKLLTNYERAAWIAIKFPSVKGDALVIGGITPEESGTAYRWHTNFGQVRSGISRTFAEAQFASLAGIQPGCTNKKITILNPQREGIYRCP